MGNANPGLRIAGCDHDGRSTRRAGAEGTKLDQSSKADPAQVARAGYDAMMKGSDHVMAPFKAKVRAALTSVLPESVITSRARADE